MNGLLEFVFEGVPANQLAQLIMDCLCEEENVSDATQDGVNLPLKFVLDPAYWSSIGSVGEDKACTLNLRVLRIRSKSVERATLQIIHYSDINDVSVLLASTDCKQGNVSNPEEIYQWAREISEKYSVDNFFGGLEPASDEHTQLFSKSGVGPVKTIG